MFLRISGTFSWAMGHPITVVLVLVGMLVWAAGGPVSNWSTAWELIAGAGYEALSILLLFLLHSNAVRDSKGMQLKLDELIRNTPNADNRLIEIERTTEQEMREFEKMEERERQRGF